MKVVALAGGTGSAKLLRSLRQLPIDLTIVANVGDNFWTYGVYVCPDIDIATYTLAGIADPQRGWGIEGDTFEAMSQLARLGFETWFRLGDRDMATSLVRTELLRKGVSLTDATERVRRAFGVACPILPATDDPIETRVRTSARDLHLQEFWVRDKGEPRVNGVRYSGARRAHVADKVRSAISAADRVVLCPANPVTSIGPMLAIPGFAKMLQTSNARIVAVSPMAGKVPFSGPVRKFLLATGSKPDSKGVAALYKEFIDCILIAKEDLGLSATIENMGIEVVATDIRMDGPEEAFRVSKELLEV